MATSPQYAATPKIGSGTVSAANTNRDGTGTLVTILTAGSNGSRIDWLVISAPGTTTAGMIRLFLSDGTNHRLFLEIPVIATTPSSTIPAFRAEQALPGLVIPSGWTLRAATHVAETFNVLTIGGDF